MIGWFVTHQGQRRSMGTREINALSFSKIVLEILFSIVDEA
ncbi:hypothetical protein [Xylella fastidiosa]|nr:hypothetical protein [Xylella fastidiosa]